jgi:hypothetical protein
MEIVRVKYRTHVAQTMPGDGRDFGFCTSGESQPGNGGPAKIIESHPDNSSLRARFAPGRSEAVACRLSIRRSSRVID